MSATAQTGYFFMPEHIILVGASERPHSLGERIFSHLLGSSYQGKITPVNLRHSSVAGIPSYSSLSKIPGQADLVVAVIPPDHYDSLFKACRKKDLRHIILIQDWENLPPESCKNARSIIQKHHGDELNITVCNSAGIQLPSLNLNIGTQADYPAGHIALLTGHSTVSRNINHLLNTLHQGVSRHISLNYDLSPTTSADWLNRFGHNRHTKVAVIHYNPAENQRELFSAIRHFARHTPLILLSTHYTDDTDKAILRSLSRHCNFQPVFNNAELEAALKAHLSGIPVITHPTILSDTPIEWLRSTADTCELTLDLPTDAPSIRQGCIGSNPTPARIHRLALEQLQNPHTQALLGIISPDTPDAYSIHQTLDNLAQKTSKPILVSYRFSDSLTRFNTPEEALLTLYFRNQTAYLQQVQNTPAPAKTGRLKTPKSKSIDKAIASGQTELMAEALYLPPCQTQKHNAVQFRFSRHAIYGNILTTHYNGKTEATLPPFTTLDIQRLSQFSELDNTSVLNQFLHSLNTLIRNNQHIGDIILNYNGSQYSSTIIPEVVEKPAAPATKIPKKAVQTLEQAAAKMQSAAAYLQQKNPVAAEFLRNTGEAASELLHPKTETPEIQNVLAPYPSQTDTFTLPDGNTLHIRALEPEDAEAKQQFVRQLPAADRYTRFMTHTNELPLPTLARLTRPDFHTECAWAAFASDGRIVAVSRYSRINRNECEFGITLAPEARKTGLAGKMMSLIIQTATQQGYQTMNAEILKENTPMLKLAEKSGFTVTPSETDLGLYQASLDLNEWQNSNKNK